ncbi:hypothetical protein RRSWK_01804 [Rhodopirellula sp. SWK7]|nr:hypothetical protein RRSWK_01804 [Rhodopirellula sp. SWK7]
MIDAPPDASGQSHEIIAQDWGQIHVKTKPTVYDAAPTPRSPA